MYRMTDHRSQALDHVEAVHHTRATLRELFKDQSRDPREVARYSHDLGDALKLADVHATLAVADSLDRVVEQLAHIRARLVEATDIAIVHTPNGLLEERFGSCSRG